MRKYLRMSSKNKLLAKLSNSGADKTWSLADAELLLTKHGFISRKGKGSHINFSHPALNDVFTIPAHGRGIKPAYVKMIRQAISDLPADEAGE